MPLNISDRDGGDEDAAAVRVRAASLCYVLAKAIAVFCVAGAGLEWQGKGHLIAVEAMFLMSVVVAHLSASRNTPPAASADACSSTESTSRGENTQRRVRRSGSEADGPCSCALLTAVLSRRGAALACCGQWPRCPPRPSALCLCCYLAPSQRLGTRLPCRGLNLNAIVTARLHAMPVVHAEHLCSLPRSEAVCHQCLRKSMPQPRHRRQPKP